MNQVFYFVATNLLLLGVVLSVLGLDGRSTGGARVIAGILGMGGSFIPMTMSTRVAKRPIGARVLDNPVTPTTGRWLVETVGRQAQQAGIGVPELAVGASPLKGAAEAIGDEAKRCMRLWGSAGRAAERLVHCSPWLPVMRLSIYNVDGMEGAGVADMMAKGRRGLGAIAAVRELVTGEAVKQNAAFRYTWLAPFRHPTVIDSYRDHPDQVAFADRWFKPVAGRRLSIDYQAVEPPLPGPERAAVTATS